MCPTLCPQVSEVVALTTASSSITAHQLVSGQGIARVMACSYHAYTCEPAGEPGAGLNLNSFNKIDK